LCVVVMCNIKNFDLCMVQLNFMYGKFLFMYGIGTAFGNMLKF